MGKGHSYHVHDMLGVEKNIETELGKNEEIEEIDTSLIVGSKPCLNRRPCKPSIYRCRAISELANWYGI